MKFILGLSVMFLFSLSWAEDLNLESPSELSAMDEDVEGLSLEAPEVTESELSSESDSSQEQANVEQESDRAANQESSNQQATTEEVLKEKEMIKPEQTTENNTLVSFGDVTGTQKYKITCVLNNDIRVITVIQQADGSVGVVYTKFGETKTIALAKNDPAYADQVAEKIQNNLANGQYPYSCTKE